MGIHRYGVRALGFALMLAVAGCGGGSGNDPSSATSARVTAVVAQYFDALRRRDVAGVRATLAPDYHFDGKDAAAASNPFDAPLGLTYRSLEQRIEAVTTRGSTATVSGSTVFEGNLNLEPFDAGRPPVNGSGRFVLELEPRGAEWKLTAVRPYRVSYKHEQTPAPRLYDYTVNGQLSANVAPGTPLKLSGKSDIGVGLFASVGDATAAARLSVKLAEPWELTLAAPSAAGRFLAYALSFTFFTDPNTGEIQFLAGDQIAIPVTVTSP